MADVPRALLRALAERRVPIATRYLLCVAWTYATAREAQAARESGGSLVVRVTRGTLAGDTGEDERSVRRHLKRLEEAGAVARIDDVAIRLLGVGDLHPRTDESGEDSGVLGPASPGRTDESGGGGPTSPPPRTDESGAPDSGVLPPGLQSPP